MASTTTVTARGAATGGPSGATSGAFGTARPPGAEPPRRPRPLLLVTVLMVAALLLLPVLFLILEARDAGWSDVGHLIFRHLTATLLWNTVRLSVAVTALAAALGVAAGYCVERTDLPGRRVWAVLVVVPVAIPDFVVGWSWVSIGRGVHGFVGAVLVMTLATYPLVYLPVAAALRGTDPALEEAARSLGLGRVETFWRVTLRQIRPAVAGGSVVVALALLAEYGAFEVLRFQTFTTTIYTEYRLGFNAPAASALSLLLVLLSVFVLGGEAAATGRRRVARGGPQASRPPARQRLGRGTGPVLFCMVGLVGLSVGVPVGAISYWLLRGGHSTLPGVSIANATWHTFGYAFFAAAVATALAIPVALLGVRHLGRGSSWLVRSTFVVQALPGLVIALALVLFVNRYLHRLYGHAVVLVLAYAMMFFPLALVAVRASVAQARPQLEEVARSLGTPAPMVLVRVTMAIIAPGLAAAFSLVFLSAVTELTATLVLIPTGAHTLATTFWAFTENVSYGAAAPYAAMMVAIAVVPSYVLGRWFDRLPSRQVVAT